MTTTTQTNLDFATLTQKIEKVLAKSFCGEFKDIRRSLFENEVFYTEGLIDNEIEEEELEDFLFNKEVRITVELIDGVTS